MLTKGCPANCMYYTCQPVCFTNGWKVLVNLGNYFQFLIHDTVHVYGVIQSLSHVRLCDPIDCSTPGSSIFLSLGVCSNSCPLSQWCYLTISSSAASFSFCLQSFPASGSFPMSQIFAAGGQINGTSTSVSIPPMNIQGWFSLGLIGLISLQSKGLSRVFSRTTIRKHQFFSLSLLYGPTLTSIYDYWKKLSVD